MALTPMEKLIDEACRSDKPGKPHRDQWECTFSMREKLVGDGCEICNPELAADIARDNLEDAADSIASEVLHHIDQMYPAMWEGVPKTARTSVRNTIRQQVVRHLSPNKHSASPADA